MVVLIAHVSIKSDCVSQFLSHANAMLAPSRAEEACISYDFYTKPEDPTQLVFVEEWKTREGLEQHFNFPYFIQFQTNIAELVNSVEINIYNGATKEQ
ncbi:MAG: putative quinol monooxygenase [Fimbriimonadaceae bacterium]